MEYIHLDSVESTNDYARSLLAKKKTDSGIIVVSADEQTKGRGQRGNSWESEKGKNLTFSMLCYPVWVSASKQFVLSQSIALAILDVLFDTDKAYASKYDKSSGFSVKWPNDIYYGDKKISGTLIECDLCGKSISNCIIGSGVNVNQKEFKSDAPNPISLFQIYKREFELEKLLRDVCERFKENLEMIRRGYSAEIKQRYFNNLYRRDGFYRYKDKDGEFMARIKDVEDNGVLLLEREDREVKRYEFKEVAFVF